MIPINDMFRLRSFTDYFQRTVWILEEWQPSPHSVEGRWQAITAALEADAMDELLEQMQCPRAAREAFRRGSSLGYSHAGISAPRHSAREIG